MEEITEIDEAGNETARYVSSTNNARIDIIVRVQGHDSLLIHWLMLLYSGLGTRENR